jgi:Protein of unknown function (DUF4238)
MDIQRVSCDHVFRQTILVMQTFLDEIWRGTLTTEKQGQTKRQHYVPQMILRKFSRNAATTSLLVMESGRRVDGAPIKRQCYEPYFYGADQVIEKSFADQESKVGGLLGDLSPSTLRGLGVPALRELRMFVHYQHARTRGAAESLSRFILPFLEIAARGTAKLSGGDTDLPQKIPWLKDAQNESIWQAANTTPLLLDLAVKFVTAKGQRGFVIADHPVVFYNQFAEKHPVLSRFPTSTGLAVKGLQLFLPLSPSVALALYDPVTYSYGSDDDLLVGAGPNEVNALNRMQAINAWECIFFDASRIENDDLDGLLTARRNHPSRYNKHVAVGEMRRLGDGTARQLVVVTDVDIRIGAKLSFVRTVDQGSYEDYQGPTIPVRSPELVALMDAYSKQLEARAKKGVEAAGGKPT